MPTAEKLQFEQKYTYGMGQLSPVQAFLEVFDAGHAETYKGKNCRLLPDCCARHFVHVDEGDLPNEDNLRLAMSEEVN
eukprot:671675-Amphidinium_carterae.1